MPTSCLSVFHHFVGLALKVLFRSYRVFLTFITKRLQHWCFPVNIAKFLRTPILKNICERLLLDIPAKILEKCSNSTVTISQKLFNETLRTGHFPDKLKLADITPVLKKKNCLEKECYGPVSVLLMVSKIYEK